MDHVIIGNGVAGITAARLIREREPTHSVTVISGETDYYYSRTALMYIAMNDMRLEDTEPYERGEYEAKDIRLSREWVRMIRSDDRVVELESGKTLGYDRLLLATGALPGRHPAVEGDPEGVCYFVSYQDLEECLRMIPLACEGSGRAAVIGGGLIGIEMCEVFLHHGLEVDFFVRGGSFFRAELSEAEGRFTEDHMREMGLDVHTGTSIDRVETDDGRVRAVVTESGERVRCDIVAVAVGVVPNIGLAERSGLGVGKGIRCDWNLFTGTEGIYTAGDCVEIFAEGSGKGFIRTIWYSARDMGEIAGRNMLGDGVPYDPGPWYNSAKFLEKEYTACGANRPVSTGGGGHGGGSEPADSAEESGSFEEYVYIAPDKTNSVRVVHENGALRGFSMIGGRWNHDVLLDFIAKHRDLEYFFRHYREALFEPELFPLLEVRDTTGKA
jgi:NADPH-dependent 2,4-dienoyl-CoA reductase/sulfur reductase-like enzyme